MSKRVNLMDWPNRLDEAAELLKHSTLRTKNKTSLLGLARVINFQKVTGLKEEKVNNIRLMRGHNFTTNKIPALVNALGGVNTLPQFMSTFFPEIQQRKDYCSAVDIAASNLSSFDYALKRDKTLKKLFVPFSKYDPDKADKKIIADVYRALMLAVVNQIKGEQLGLTSGDYAYIRTADLMLLLSRPQKASKRQVYNALVYLRIAGAITLAKESELSAEGKHYLTININGHILPSNCLYHVEKFANISWGQLASNFEVNLSVHPSHEQIAQVVGEETARNFFPDVNAGATREEYLTMLSLHNFKGNSDKPLVTVKSLSKTLQSTGGGSPKTSERHIDQLLTSSSLEMKKMTVKSAELFGYDMSGYKRSAKQSKVIVSNSREALLQCLGKSRKDKEDLLRINSLLKQKSLTKQ